MTTPAFDTTTAAPPVPTPTPAPKGIVSGAVNADGSYTGANGQSYTAGQVSGAQNQVHNDSYASDYYRQKFGTSMPAPTSFGMPLSVEKGDEAAVRAWIDGMTPPPASGGSSSSTSSTGVVGSATGGSKGGVVSSGYNRWDVTPEQTVEGRIQSIINPNNPIIASARADAVDGMNARGLADSTLAITAADKAAFAAAIPIAQQDAATAAKATGYNADIQNQMSMQRTQLGSQEKIAGMQIDSQKAIAQLNSDTQKTIAGLDNANRVQVQQLQLDNQKLLQTSGNAATAFNQSMVAIANIEQNDKMDAPAKTAAIAQIMQNLQMQLHTIGAVAGIDLSGTLDFRNMPGFDANGVWVGLPAAGAPDHGGGANTDGQPPYAGH